MFLCQIQLLNLHKHITTHKTRVDSTLCTLIHMQSACLFIFSSYFLKLKIKDEVKSLRKKGATSLVIVCRSDEWRLSVSPQFLVSAHYAMLVFPKQIMQCNSSTLKKKKKNRPSRCKHTEPLHAARQEIHQLHVCKRTAFTPHEGG